jgi:hypothetical protein
VVRVPRGSTNFGFLASVLVLLQTLYWSILFQFKNISSNVSWMVMGKFQMATISLGREVSVDIVPRTPSQNIHALDHGGDLAMHNNEVILVITQANAGSGDEGVIDHFPEDRHNTMW